MTTDIRKDRDYWRQEAVKWKGEATSTALELDRVKKQLRDLKQRTSDTVRDLETEAQQWAQRNSRSSAIRGW